MPAYGQEVFLSYEFYKNLSHKYIGNSLSFLLTYTVQYEITFFRLYDKNKYGCQKTITLALSLKRQLSDPTTT